MTTTANKSVVRPLCVSCTRPQGRRRPQLVDECDELFVCDLCWHLAGGREAIEARAAGEKPVPLLEVAPEAEALVAAADCDRLHPIDRLLVESGIRWTMLRHIVPAARADLAVKVVTRTPPAGTRRADSAQCWMDVVTERIATSPEFRYPCKKRRYWRIARIYALCADHHGRPLTWVRQQEIATATRCDSRTVRRCLKWLKEEGLLYELVQGCRVPAMQRPEGETPQERQQREQLLAEAIAAEEAAMARARAELDAVRNGLLGAHAAAAAAQLTPPQIEESEERHDKHLIKLCPVYELRVPVDSMEAEEARAIAEAHTPLPTPGQKLLDQYRGLRVAPANVHLYGRLWAVTPDGRLDELEYPRDFWSIANGHYLGYLRFSENVHPPQVHPVKELKSNSVHPVDKRQRRASRGHDQGELSVRSDTSVTTEFTPPETRARPKKASRAQRTAERLVQSLLHPSLAKGVSIRWLAARLRASGLLAHDQWTDHELADHLRGLPDYPHLPRHITHPRRWISARLAKAHPLLPPSRRRAIHHAETVNTDERHAARHRAETRAIRDAVDACPHCDEFGWLDVDTPAGAIRCNHDPDTGGW